jgi:hypothetical protein
MLGHGPLGAFPLGSAGVPLWFAANFAKQRQKPDEDRTFAAFGRFIASYALAEAGFHIAARSFSGMPEAKARIVFAGMRLADVTERLSRFVAETPNAKEIAELISQFDLIGSARDQFVHRLIEYRHREGLTVTNRLTCKIVTQTEPRTFTVSELEAMEYDCRVIFGRLALVSNHADASGVNTDLSLMSLFGSWQYTPPVRDTPTKQTREAQKEFKHKRRASRASPPDQPEEK